MSTGVTDTYWMTHRQLRALVKQPAYLVVSLVQPVIWLFLFGAMFRRIVELPGFGAGSYLDYLIPGVVAMSALSSAMWSGMGVMEEIQRGTMNRFLVTPVARSAVLNSISAQTAVSTAIQSLIIARVGRRRALPRGPCRAGGADHRIGPAGAGGQRVLQRDRHDRATA